MQTYKTLITVRGLCRVDPLCAREPIGEGEVIALPNGFARSLLDIGAIEPTDADVTVELDWKPPVTLVKSDDRERLIEALTALGVSDLPIMPSPSAAPLGGISPTDAETLAQALEALGAKVTLPGETVGLDDVLASDLMDEISARIAAGAISAADLPESVIGLAATVIKVPEATLEAGGPPAGSEPLPPVGDAPPPVAATAPAKPARKGKA